MDAITSLFESLDWANLMPKTDAISDAVTKFVGFAILAGPIILLVLGLIYLLLPPKEANHRFGFRTWFGMGSVAAWRFAQRIAGITWSALGLVLTIIMLVRKTNFEKMSPMEMIPPAITCMLWQAGLVFVSYIAIGIVVAVFYDYKGNRRRK